MTQSFLTFVPKVAENVRLDAESVHFLTCLDSSPAAKAPARSVEVPSPGSSYVMKAPIPARHLELCHGLYLSLIHI